LAKFLKGIDAVCAKLSWVSIGVTFFLMCMTSIHVLLRKFTPWSIPGSIELTELSLVVIVFCAVGYLQSQNGHVRVDMFVGMLPKRAQHFISFVILLLSAVTLVGMFYAALLQITAQLNSGLATSVLRIPIWPFVIISCIGILLYAVSLFGHALNELALGVRGGASEEIQK
jgi:TRAP-type C4-dicarboxylate transport system permease small subunit